MKNPIKIMKPYFFGKVLLIMVLLHVQANTLLAQEGDSTATTTQKPAKDKRPVKDMFESGYLLNNQTAKISSARTLEFIIQHRFGLLNAEGFDLAGLYAPSNIRIGFNYSFTDRFQLGFGTTKNNMLQDLTWKVALLKQTRSGSVPLSITYFGEAAVDCRANLYPEFTNRLSYFNQIIFARKFSNRVSIQLAPSISYFNMVDTLVNRLNIGASFNGRVKLTDALAILFEFDQNFTTQDAKVITVKPNVGIGIEASTSAHVFQIFVCTGQSIINQHNMLYNSNDFAKMDFCIGFNVTRLWNY